MAKAYKKQVALLLSVLPEVAKETCFALHGGTAINLFVRDMPRLSVDIDLTYVPIEDRAESFANIAKTLEKIKATIEATIPSVVVSHKQEICKLLISVPGADIKLEVNQIGRGVLSEPVKMTLCEKAQNDFDSYCVVPVVPLGQLYGGKICAALDRQHPRDLFDVKYLLQNEGFSDEIKKGFLLDHRFFKGNKYHQANNFSSLKRKNLTSVTPLKLALKSFNFALYDSACAFVLLLSKKFKMFSQ